MTGQTEIAIIDRKLAQSGKVSHSSPIILYETSKTKKVAVPFYIPRSDGTDLSLKIMTYAKNKGFPREALIEKECVNLDESTLRKLLSTIQSHLAISDEGDGSFIQIKVADGVADISKHDPALVANALTKVLSQHEIVQHLKNAELGTELVHSLKTAIRLKEMRSAVEELRGYLDNSENSEAVYQSWCEKHTWAFGNAYVMRDNVRSISIGDKLDLILPTVIAGYRDIVELKRPNIPVLQEDKIHKNYYFASDVSQAIGQCHRYLDVFHEEAQKGLRDHPEIVAYHPRAIIVIGRSHDWVSDKTKALHGLNQRLNCITIMTYDHLLAQGERLLSFLSDAPNDQNPTNSLYGLDKDILF